jgi:peptidoglycan/xylan/chitin deacetylase (PgdA/CDA1 family)
MDAAPSNHVSPKAYGRDKPWSHGIMFHYFHGPHTRSTQGSICEQQFEDSIAHIARSKNICAPEDYVERVCRDAARADDVVLTFDDGLAAQKEVAIPVLHRLGLRGMFFVYSGPLDGHPDVHELYRRFRNEGYPSVDEFYEAFHCMAEACFAGKLRAAHAMPADYLGQFTFYSRGDRQFRYLRDVVLGAASYREVMERLIESGGKSRAELARGLWMTAADLKDLSNAGHLIGLHSYSHPTMLHALSEDDQRSEYAANQRHLEHVTGSKVRAVAHPNGNYTSATLAILRTMGVVIGFRSSCTLGRLDPCLEIPREDNANVLAEIA